MIRILQFLFNLNQEVTIYLLIIFAIFTIIAIILAILKELQ